MASKDDPGTKGRVLRMSGERRSGAPRESLRTMLRRLLERVGIPVRTVRDWVARVEVDAGKRPGLTSSESADITALMRENVELKRVDETFAVRCPAPVWGVA